MAATQAAPLADTMSIEEAVEFLRPTGYPVSSKQLGRWLTNAGAPRDRIGRAYYFLTDDILELHRAHVHRTKGK